VTGKRGLLHALFLVLLPLVVAWYGLSVASTLALVLLGLLWRWAVTLSGLMAPVKTPELELETISASHFVEKVRWCMDRLGLDYVETPCAGALGVFTRGRTVPLLKFRTGAVLSSIGNSPEILRYLWGRYEPELGEKAEFLAADAERLELERKIDRCGANLQVWVYHHILPDPQLTLHAWGYDNPKIPAWQRWTIKVIYPVQASLIRKAFRISDEHYEKSVTHISALLAEVEALLEDGRQSILGGDRINYTDLSFAAIMGLWLQPEGFGRGKADAVRIDIGDAPPKMREDIEYWREKFPRATAFIENLYREQRKAPEMTPDS